MAFAYYKRLSRHRQAIYRHSDAIQTVRLTDAQQFFTLTEDLAVALAAEDQKEISRISRELVTSLCRNLDAPRSRVRVLAKRPSDDWGELHGLYEPEDGGQSSLITVWMRTAQRKKVVAFKTFLRTLLHEFCHHLDYELFRLEESLHTEGFYKRESSLFHQIVRDSMKKTGKSARERRRAPI